MKKQLSRLSRSCLLLALLFGSAMVSSDQAVAQYAPTLDASAVTLSWTLDPTEIPGLVAHDGYGARSVLTGMDFDGDGNKEFLFTTDETLAPGGPDPGVLDLVLYENTGDNTYEHVWHYSFNDSTNSLPPVAWGDIDEDGLFEIYFGVPTLPRKGDPNDLFVFEQNEDGTFPDEPTVSYGYERAVGDDFRPAGFQVIDVDNDGQQELITVSRTGGARELVVIEPVGGLDAFTAWTIEFEAGEALLGGGGLYDVDVVDFDGDGNNEIWVSTWNLLSMTVFEVTGEDSYELQTDIDEVTPDTDHGSFNSHELHFFDIDEDGDMELLFPTTNGALFLVQDTDDVSTLTGDSFVYVGSFYPADIAPGTGEDDARGSDIGDLDGDGNLDIILSGGRSERIFRAEFDGSDPADSTSYTWTVILDSGSDDDTDPQERYYPLRIADDLDGDGMNEIVLTNLFASDPGQPIIVILEAAMSTAIEDDETPSDFALKQNYPNPFNPSTTIEYVLPASATVSVRVYNLMGQVVRTLVQEEAQTLGRHSVTWDGRSDAGTPVASGTYLYSLEFNGTIQTRPMTLIK